jgi:hypothetical protein
MNFRILNEFTGNSNQKMNLEIEKRWTGLGPAFGPWLKPAAEAACEARSGDKADWAEVRGPSSHLSWPMPVARCPRMHNTLTVRRALRAVWLPSTRWWPNCGGVFSYSTGASWGVSRVTFGEVAAHRVVGRWWGGRNGQRSGASTAAMASGGRRWSRLVLQHEGKE